MKNFDETRNEKPRRTREERSFVIGGETFVARDRFRPDVMTLLESLPRQEVDKTTCDCTHRIHEHPRMAACGADGCECQKFTPLVTQRAAALGDQLAAFDETILGMIEDGEEGGEGHERWLAVRANVEDPIDVDDMLALVQWMTEADTGRPTAGPSVSSAGPASTKDGSTAVSSRPETLPV